MSKSSERIDETICLYKFTGVFHSYIYFTLNNDTTITIRTPWIITYQNKIKDSLLKNDNINLLTEQQINIIEKNNCDWITKANFREFAVQKGSVFSNINNNNTDQIKKAVSLSIESLDDNYPLIEIFMILLVPIIIIIALIIYLIIDEIKTKKRNNDNYSISV